MQSPFNVKGMPLAAGGGLPGLPVIKAGTTNVNNLYSASDKKILTPVGNPVSLGAGSYYGGGFPVRPVKDLMLVAYHNGANYMHMPVSYGASGLTARTAVTAVPNDGNFMSPDAYATLSGKVVWQRGSHLIRQAVVNPSTFAVSVSTLCIPPSAGTLTTGESFTRTDNTEGGRSNRAINNYGWAIDGQGNYVMFFVGTVAGSTLYVCAMTIDIETGAVLRVDKLFVPSVTAGSPTERTVHVRKIGGWYHVVFIDVGPGTSYAHQLQYYAVSDDFAQVVNAFASAAQSQSSSSYLQLFMGADERSVLFGVANIETSITLIAAQSRQFRLDASGKPILTDANNQLASNSTEIANSSADTSAFTLQQKVFCPSTGLLVPASTGSGLLSGSNAKRRFRFSTRHGTTGGADETWFQAVGYRTLGSDVNVTIGEFFDAATPMMLDDSQSYSAFGAIQTLQPLLDGYWIGHGVWSTSDYRLQLFKEI